MKPGMTRPKTSLQWVCLILRVSSFSNYVWSERWCRSRIESPVNLLSQLTSSPPLAVSPHPTSTRLEPLLMESRRPRTALMYHWPRDSDTDPPATLSNSRSQWDDGVELQHRLHCSSQQSWSTSAPAPLLKWQWWPPINPAEAGNRTVSCYVGVWIYMSKRSVSMGSTCWVTSTSEVLGLSALFLMKYSTAHLPP